LQSQQEAMVLFELSIQGRLQFGNLLAQKSFANSAISWGVAFPSMSARSINRPDIPKTSVATLANLMLAVSSSFSRRLRSAAWLSTGGASRGRVNLQSIPHPSRRFCAPELS